jgi:hypothetical protein
MHYYLDQDQCIVVSDAAIHAITASEKPLTRVHAPCWYEATFTMVPRPPRP